MLEASFDWAWELDAQGRYTYAGPQIELILGYSPEEIVGRTPFDLMPPAEAQRVGTAFTAVAAERRPFRMLENRNLHRDGHEVVLETSGVPILAPDGSLVGYRGFDRDVTESRRATADLAAERRRLRALIDTLPDLVWLEDPDGVYLLCNPAFERLSGPPSEPSSGVPTTTSPAGPRRRFP